MSLNLSSLSSYINVNHYLQRVVQSSNFRHFSAVILEESILGIQIPISIRILIIVSCYKPRVSVDIVSCLKSWNYFLNDLY